MATTGSQPDFVARLKAVLPVGWFPAPAAAGQPSTSPGLDSVLAGPANIFAAVWQLLAYLLAQTRIATATGAFLDMIAVDFFGTGGLSRNAGETDAAYRTRILASLFPSRVTRPAVASVLTKLTGSAPTIIEPRNASDTKGYASMANAAVGGGYGYEVPGGMHYGTMLAPFQAFITVDDTKAKLPTAAINQALVPVLPEAVIAWTQVTNAPS